MEKPMPVLGSKDEQFNIHGVHELARYVPHSHLFYEIGYFARGQGVLYINDKKFYIKAPMLHFCPPKPAWHSFETTTSTLHTASIAVYPRTLFGSSASAKLSNTTLSIDLLKQFCNRPRPLVKLSPTAAVHVEQLLDLMIEEHRLGLPGHTMIIGGYVQQLLVLAQREEAGISSRAWRPALRKNIAPPQAQNISPTQKPILAGRDPRIENTIILMRKGIKYPHGNSSFAKAAGMEEKYFIRLFTQEVGISPQRYFLRLRLEAAAHYLIHTTLPIEEIAHLHGFQYRSNFHAAFMRLYKTTPSLYRYIHSGKSK